MIRAPFFDGWSVGPQRGAFESADATPRSEVTVPHDAVRDAPRTASSDQGVHTGYVDGGSFEYTKTFDVPQEWAERSVLIEFEGVYRDAAVALNGDFVLHHRSGYTGFVVELDPFLRFGQKNTLTVQARADRDSRWYSGAGIYRPVHLIVTEPVRIAVRGTTVLTPEIDTDAALIALATPVENRTRHARRTRVQWQIIDAAGDVVAQDDVPLTVPAGESATARARLRLVGPRRWSVEDPTLYTVRTALVEASMDPIADTDPGRVLDEDVATFGIRTLQLDAAHGLRINGETVLLRGACIHHDNGVLGAASLPGAEDRRIRLLKAAGFNAIRSAHNPISRALLDACDRHGMLVMDELTDVWTRSKTTNDSSGSFPASFASEVAAMVDADRNHPSVIMYSIGNEILELSRPLGAAWGRRVAEEFRRLDPTRYVTNGINGVIANLDLAQQAMAEAPVDPNTMMANMGEMMGNLNASPAISRSIEEAASMLDVVGFNYADSRYRLDAIDHPHRVIVGSETFPARIATMWSLVRELPHVIGDFTWTGWDYLGEAGIGRVDYKDEPGYEHTGTAGPFPHLLAGCGDLDITGFRRPISYYREIAFGLRADPFIAVHPPVHHGRPVAVTPWSWDDSVASWTWDAAPGAPVTVDVYADADEVELLRDGVSQARARVGDPLAFIARFETTYQPGALTAVAYREGAVVGTHELRTAAGRLALAANVERSPIDGTSFVEIVLADVNGTVPADHDIEVSVAAVGAELLGVGTGRIRTEEGFAGPAVTLHNGRALAVLSGTGELVVTAEGYEELRVPLQ